MRLLVDMNMSPDLCARFRAMGREAVHWSVLGTPNAPDTAIMAHAKAHSFVVLTHDLDFGAILASTRAEGPSVVQIRTEDVMSDRFVSMVSTTLTRFEAELSAGALVIVDESRSRVRVLPMGS
jgi:predicted nuclease of predicted toxin-antitoxin system